MSLLSLFAILINTGYGSSDRDIGCNYVNIDGSAMPIDYCMEMVFSEFEVGIKYVCNATWDGVELEYYFDKECAGTPAFNESMNSSYVHADYTSTKFP